MSAEPHPSMFRERRLAPSSRPRISVALVNNMPDAALQATERQFRRLVARSVRAEDVDFKVYFFSETRRSATGDTHCRTHYRPVSALLRGRVDALIVTGCEPIAPSLRAEPFWGSFAQLVDWARTSTRSALWSCLAAHAAILHLDGIERHRLPRKLSGVFASEQARHHRLLAGLPDQLCIPHSRHNTLDEEDLLAAGYAVLTRSDRLGPDVFTKTTPSLFVFFQGHPEYDPDSLGREFRRDLKRYLDGSAAAPMPPENYFDADVTRRLAAVANLAAEDRQAAMTELAIVTALVEAGPTADWHAAAARMYRNWLSFVADGIHADPPRPVRHAARTVALSAPSTGWRPRARTG